MSIEHELTKPIHVDGIEKRSLILFPPPITDIKYLKKMSFRISTGVRQWLIYFAKYSDPSYSELGELHAHDARRLRKIAIEQINALIRHYSDIKTVDSM